MAVWSIVKMSELEGSRRLDAEYYRPECLKLKGLLSRHAPLAECVEKIMHPVEVRRVYEQEGLQVLLAQNIQHNFLDFSVTVFMPESVRGSILRNRVLPNDVVMTRSGANYGDASPYFGDPGPLYACADCLVIRPRREFPGGYLATFFNTDGGRALIKRGGYGAGQPHVAPPFLKTLRVPRFSRAVEEQVDRLVRLAGHELRQSESMYLKAERRALEELGWGKAELSQPEWWTASFSGARRVQRVDAEHFQPKYEKLIAHLKMTGRAKPLGEVAAYIKRGLQPRYAEDGDIIVVNSQHLGRYMLNVEATERTDSAFWDQDKSRQLRKYDLLMYSTGAFVGRTNAWLEDQEGVASNHVTIIRAQNARESVYLAVFLNAGPGMLQAEKWASGSGQREVYPQDIARFIVYLPLERIQKRVAELVQRSCDARRKAKALLEEAKARVQGLVEKSANKL